MLIHADSIPNGKSTAPRFRYCASGFTLIELLVVMAIVLILASITFGITRGVQGAQARAKAQGELAVLAQALEQFKLRYGDYPRVLSASQGDRNESLTHALTGRRIIQRSGNNIILTDALTFEQAGNQGRPTFIDITRFNPSQPNELRDPWGNRYEYHYKISGTTGAGWEPFGYILYSRGPRNQSLNVNSNGVFTLTPSEIAERGIMLSGQ
jgi:prepilin-type N-terminal cleavage/methylation domain-containing protein